MYLVFRTIEGSVINLPINRIMRIEYQENNACFLIDETGNKYIVKGSFDKADSIMESISAVMRMKQAMLAEKAAASGAEPDSKIKKHEH